MRLIFFILWAVNVGIGAIALHNQDYAKAAAFLCVAILIEFAMKESN